MCLTQSANVMNFYISKLKVTLFTALSPVSTLCHSSRGKQKTWLYDLIYETHSASYLINDFLTMAFGEYWASEAIASGICQLNCMFLVFGPVQNIRRTEHFLVINFIWALDYSDWEERFLNVLTLPNDFITFWKTAYLIL